VPPLHQLSYEPQKGRAASMRCRCLQVFALLHTEQRGVGISLVDTSDVFSPNGIVSEASKALEPTPPPRPPPTPRPSDVPTRTPTMTPTDAPRHPETHPPTRTPTATPVDPPVSISGARSPLRLYMHIVCACAHTRARTQACVRLLVRVLVRACVYARVRGARTDTCRRRSAGFRLCQECAQRSRHGGRAIDVQLRTERGQVGAWRLWRSRAIVDSTDLLEWAARSILPCGL
jgi:hypothetical protein